MENERQQDRSQPGIANGISPVRLTIARHERLFSVVVDCDRIPASSLFWIDNVDRRTGWSRAVFALYRYIRYIHTVKKIPRVSWEKMAMYDSTSFRTTPSS